MNRPTSRPSSSLPTIVIALAVLAVVAYVGWRYFIVDQRPMPSDASAVVAPVEPLQSGVPAPLAPVTSEAPAIENPIEVVAPETTATVAGPAAALPGLGDSDPLVTEKLTELLGRKDVLTFLQLDGFARRVVATVDNLARSHAPPKVWPVNPTPQRFTVQRGGDGVETIAPANSQRYAPLVQMIESVDTARAVGIYRSLYPLFQQAYEELGFPGKYFNDRLVQVLDHLIATPVPPGPLAVTLVEVKGEVPSLRPWVRYEYANPAYESLSAGQKILLRVGPDNQRKLQAKMKDIRQKVAKP
jgi:hypothetical protein